MAATVIIVPQFRREQRVNFIGGSGTIKSYWTEAGSWSYLVEIEMEPKPEMGKIGYETTILLNQSDLMLQKNSYFSELPMSA